MKKIITVAATFCLLLGCLVFYKPVQATTHTISVKSNGKECNDGATFTPSSNVTIDAGDTITFSVPSDDVYPNGIEVHNFPGGTFTVPRGGNLATPALLINVNYYVTWPSAPQCQKGSGVITVQNQTTPQPSSAAPPPVTVATPKTSTTPPPIAPPAIPKMDSAKVDGEKLDTTKPISLGSSKAIVLSGNTVANGVVELTIHSVTHTEIARANDGGFWSFELKGLEPGNHTVEAAVTDPATKKTSEKVKLLSFEVTNDTTPINPATVTPALNPANKGGKGAILLATAAVALLAIAAGAFFWLMKHKKKSKNPQKPEEPPTTTSPTPTEVAPTETPPATPPFL